MEKDRYDLYSEYKKSKFSKFLNFLFIIGLIGGIIFLGFYFFGPKDEAPTEDNTQEEQLTDVQTIEITDDPLERINFKKVGTVEPYKSATITAQAGGSVSNYTFDEGDTVEVGDVIAEISNSVSTGIASINYETALKNLDTTLKSLNTTKSSVARDIEMSGIAVSSAGIGYQNAVDAYNNSLRAWDEQIRASMLAVQSAEIGLSSAQKSYYNSLETSSSTLSNTFDQSLSSIISSLSLIDGATRTADSFLTYENTLVDAVGAHTLDTIKDDYRDLTGDYEDLLYDYSDTEDHEDSRDAMLLLNNTLDTLQHSQYMLLDIKEAINDANRSNNAEVEAIFVFLSSLETNISSMLVSIDQSRNGLNMAKSSLDGAILGSQIQPEGSFIGMEAAETQLISAKQALQIAEANKNTQIDSQKHAVELAENQLATAKVQLESMRAKANLQILGAEAQLNNIEGQTSIAEANLEGTKIKSSIEGVILDKYVEEGNYINPSQKVVRVGDMSKVYVIVSLTSDEIGFIKLGQSVKVTAPGGVVATGRVNKVNAALDPMSKKADVKVLINNDDGKLLAGMFADVLFMDAQKEVTGVFVPFKSVVFEADGNYVYVVENNKAVKKQIKLGQVAGNTLEVIDGLKLGDKVITEGAKLVEEGELVNILSDNQ